MIDPFGAKERSVSTLHEALADVPLGHPAAFAERMLELLRQEFKLQAATLHLATGASPSLRLKAQVGLKYGDYEDFSLGPDTLAYKALNLPAGNALVADDLLADPGYRDKAHVQHLSHLVAVPIIVHDRPKHVPSRLGVLCAYPAEPSTVPIVAKAMTSIAPFIGKLYLSSLERRTMDLRRRTVVTAAFRKDVTSVVHSILQILRSELHVQAASVFVWDHRKEILYLRGTTGLRRPRRMTDVRVPGEKQSLLTEVFHRGEPVSHSAATPTFRSDLVLETLSDPLANGLMYPIHIPEGARGANADRLGVIVLLNSTLTFDARTLLVEFTWEDILVLDFVAEMLAVLLFQHLKAGDLEFNFEKLMHGAQANVQGALQSLLFSDDQFNLRDTLPSDAYYGLRNAMALLGDLKAQMDGSEIVAAHRFEIRPVNLYGEVLAQLPRIGERLAERHGLRPFRVDISQVRQTYRDLPPVLGDPDALVTVFRNLIDNSVKYSNDKVNNHWARLTVEVQPDHVNIRVSDNGAGIPLAERERVFRDGYRGRHAIARTPQGLGRGLFDCARIIKMLNGELRLIDNPRASTTFAIRLQVA